MSGATSDWAALMALAIDAREALADAARRGQLDEWGDEPLPPAAWGGADDAEGRAALDEGDGDAPAPPIAAAPVPAERADAWGAVAARGREGAQPRWERPAATDGVGEAGLARVRADLGDCARCGLCKGRTQIVFGVGDPDADLMVVGEGPGEQEDQRGEPFVGPAGQMLDRMLSHVVGVPRERTYIANVVKCRPPSNRNPQPEEVAACLPFLHRQISAVRPKLILVLGAVALRHLLGVDGIMKARGKELEFQGIPALPTLHPAYLLRQPQDKRLAMDDLLLAKRRYDELGGRRDGDRSER